MLAARWRRARSAAVALACVVALAACSPDTSAVPPLAEVPDTPQAAPELAPEDPTGPGPDPGEVTPGEEPPVGPEPPAVPEPPPLPAEPLRGLALELVATGLFQPTAIATRAGDERLFVAERSGAIRIVGSDGVVGTLGDLSERVGWADGIEKGLLGLAFHPDHAANGLLYTYYVNRSAQRQLSEHRVLPDDPDQVDPASERVLFAHDQPPGSADIRHYGGMIAFGPDGMLWVASGDGADARGQGQDPATPFGAILRLDVGGDSYAIPPDNPFVAGGGAPEVWAYGLRNPWRFDLDPVDRLLYIADVGQEQWEEINVVSLDEPGANFGWADTEGANCFLRSRCDLADYTMPVLAYAHDQGCSVTGGLVYRGSAIPELWGHYLYGDWCRGWVRSFRHRDGEVTDEADWAGDLPGLGQINTFGADPAGEPLVATWSGNLHRIVPTR